MVLLQFAVPERIGTICAEVACRLAGGATLIEGLGWWTNGKGEIERERVQWLIVGVEDDRSNEVIEAVKEILKRSGESAIFYVKGSEPALEWL